MKNFKISFLAILLILIGSNLVAQEALAMDKAKLKIGPSKLKLKNKGTTTAIVAAVQGDHYNITMGGATKKGSGTLTLLIPTDAQLEKGNLINLYSLVGEEEANNVGEIATSFTAIKTKGVKVTTYSDAAETVTTGQIKVKSFDETTGVLKFLIKGSATPVNQVKADLSGSGGNETVNKKIVIKGQVVVTLPQ